jgi:sec-independent protein translocase protein TatC
MSTSTLATILDQLERVRWRLFKSLALICVLFVVGYLFVPSIFEIFVAPLKDRLRPGENLIGTGVPEVFFVELKVAFMAAVIAGSPFVFYQIGGLIAPVFDAANNRRYLIGFAATTSFFFLLGAYFCYRTVLPIAFLYFLDQYGSLGVSPEIRVSEYFSFFLRITVAFGLTFELPIFTFFLVRLGVWSYLLLWRQLRYAVLVMFVVAAVLTPPDVVSQVLLAGPLIALYLISIGIAYIFRRVPSADGTEGDD